jgi:Methyltransferase domain
MKKQLLLGCGHTRNVQVFARGSTEKPEFEDLYTLDFNPDCKPDLQCDLENKNWFCRALNSQGEKAVYDRPGAFSDKQLKGDYFDEVHAYEVLEHLGQQGRQDLFFDTFANIYRVLVHGGMLFATCPSRYSPWLWGDPGHRRAILPESLTFLDQTEYQKQLGKTAMSDYRREWRGDFQCVSSVDNRANHVFVLRAHKPARV